MSEMINVKIDNIPDISDIEALSKSVYTPLLAVGVLSSIRLLISKLSL